MCSRGTTAIVVAAQIVNTATQLILKIARLVTGPGILRVFVIPHNLMTLRIVIENKDICDPTVLMVPSKEHWMLVNHTCCDLQYLFP